VTSDGVTLIDQATVVAAGGFRYHIDKSGSYRLSSDLVVSGTNTNGIDIYTSGVSLDLNGFPIIGPGPQSNGTGASIYALGAAPMYTFTGVSVRNGSLQGWNIGVYGIDCNLCVARQLIVSNSMNGIILGNGAQAIENTVSSGRTHLTNDGTIGIGLGQDGTIMGNNDLDVGESSGNGCSFYNNGPSKVN
jgi:hypothetical protein